MKKAKIIAMAASAVMAATAAFSTPVSYADNGEMRNISTMELVRDMGIGINLGNTMESCGDWIAQYGDGSVSSYETAWGSPEVTEDMIKGYANEGFGVLRIPVAWSNLMSTDGKYTISPEYFARVRQLVDWTLNAGMYAIINIHYDSGWLEKLPENKDECMNRYTVMWTQIADYFKDYGDHLMFESQNEELGWDSVWNQWSGTQEQKERSYTLVNEVNQKFVDIIRSSGGNNPDRHLLISGYKTDIALTCDPLFKMPDDPKNRCAVSVHYYTPVGFAILTKDESWAACRTTWGTDEDFAELRRNMDLMKTTYIDKGIPVIIGEYGCPGVKEGKESASVRLFLSSVCKEAYDRHLCPVLWDTESKDNQPWLHYDRVKCQLVDRELKAAFNSIVDKKEQPTQPTETQPTETTTTATTTSTETTTTEATQPTEPTGIEAIRGDLNNDNNVNVADITILSKFLVKKGELPDFNRADLDSNGKINVFDFVTLKKILLLIQQN